MKPRLTIGLPVYNGADYICTAIDSLLNQTFQDFELVISDNVSTDATGEICRRYAAADPRVRYVLQERNLGSGGNHDFVAYEARSELFKWASDDDVYAPDLLQRCVEALEANPDVVASHSWTAMIDSTGQVVERLDYPLSTASPDPAERFRSLLFDDGGDDDYAIIRTAALRKVLPSGSHYRSDRTFTASLALQGPFHQVPDWLYFRREHPDRLTRTKSVRAWCTAMDPRRADRLRHPTARLLGEYIFAYVKAIRTAPLSPADRRRCYSHLARWLTSRARPHRLQRVMVNTSLPRPPAPSSP